MRNNHFFKTQILLAALAAAVITPIFAFAQQRPAARTAASIKDSDIYVPNEVLEPSFSKKEASDMLKEYIAAFGDSDMPGSYEAFARDPDKYAKRIGSRQIKSAMINLYNYIFDVSLKKKESDAAPVNPELMEVTEATDAWFKKLYNKALEQYRRAEALAGKSAQTFAVLRNATVPLKSSGPATAGYVLAFLFMAVVFTTWWLLLQRTLAENKRRSLWT